MSRTIIPRGTQNRLLYGNAWRCCVCHERSEIQLHHIDQDPSNNREDNLAVLCLICHGKAHSIHKLSQNLTPDRIRHHKEQHEREVQNSLAAGMLPQFVPGPAVWTYINHERLSAVLSLYNVDFDRAKLQPFIEGGIVNAQGIPLHVIPSEKGPTEPVTIYDHIPFYHGPPLIAIYSQALAQLIRAANPIDFRELESSDQVQALAKPGTLCFLHKGCRFRTVQSRKDRSEIRRVQASIAGVTVRFQIDTRLMFGSSAFSNFARSRYATALIFAKSFQPEGGKNFLDCTPLAMGTGFLNRRGPADERPRFAQQDLAAPYGTQDNHAVARNAAKTRPPRRRGHPTALGFAAPED